MEVSSHIYDPADLPPGKEHRDNHWIGGWVGRRTSLDEVAKRKISATAKNRTPVIQIVA